MTPVSQTIIDPTCGDCERACVATITGIPIGEIPNFAVVTSWGDFMSEWLPAHGWGIIETKRATTPNDYNWSGLEGVVGIASVPSQAFPGGRHAVVISWRQHPTCDGALEPYVVHDPNPNNAPYEDVPHVVERIRWLIRRDITEGRS